MDDNQITAISCYKMNTGRTFVPGEIVEIPIDALVFTEYQKVWTNLQDFEEDRCIYDSETNEWLVDLVTEVLLEPDIPPIYVDVLPDGLALVDGVHRTTAAFISNRSTILAQLNKR